MDLLCDLARLETGHQAARADLPGQEDLLLRITSRPAGPGELADPADGRDLACGPGRGRCPDRRHARALLAPSERFEVSWHPGPPCGHCHPRWAVIDPM
jgi:hypothetical protein